MRHAFRRLLKTPAFTATAVITLAAAIGANVLIFSVVNGVLLKPLPFADPSSLVGVWHVAPGIMQGPLTQSAATYLMYREDGKVFQDIGLWNTSSVTLTGRGDPEQVESLLVTDGTLPIVGAAPALGRWFSKEEDRSGAPDTVVISYPYFQRAFNGNPSAIGQTVTINGRGHQVIGVLPERFRFLRANPTVVLPFRFNRSELHFAGFNYRGVARLKPGVTIDQANADMARLIPTLLDRFPSPPGFTRKMFDDVRMGPLVRPLEVDVVGDIGGLLWVLFATVGIVLLVACANVANLFLVRAEGRQQELAVRLALGAGTKRVVQELLSESLLLGLVGGVVGLALAYGGIQLLQYLRPANLPRLDEIALDPIVLAFTLALSVLAGLLFGVLPVFKYARPQLANALKDSSRGSSEGRERHRARNTLVAAQVAMAAVLLIGSGLMIRTFVAMRNVTPGFVRPEEVLTMRISIPLAVIKDEAQTAQTHEQIVRRIEALAGVQSVGVSSSITLDGNDSNDPVFIEDFPTADGQMPALRRFKYIADGYFETMGNPIVAGRGITWADVHARAQVALISDNFAREVWGDPIKALGRRVRRSPTSDWFEIVGIAGADRQDGVTKAEPAVIYLPMFTSDFVGKGSYLQRSLGYVIRTARLQSPDFVREVQQAVWSVNPNLPLARVRTLRDMYDESMAQTSFALVILGIAGAVTLLLGVVGIYGVIAYVVAQRRREVGIRMALGARAPDVQRMFVFRGMIVTGVGLVVGVGAALAVMRLLRVILFGISPFDPLTYAAVVAGLAAVALLATWLPARRATTTDPALALRGE
jgi:putative ABC transport system permease protein